MNQNSLFSDNSILSRIYLIRNQNVMLDRDLADMYGVKTKILKQAVKRNIERFPEDFMFEMNKVEFQNWRSHFVTSNSDLMGLRYAPYCFTEQGVTMLSCILRSPIAIEVNIRIVRIYSKMRKVALDQKDLFIELEKIKSQITNQDDKINQIFEQFRSLLEQKNKPIRKIGFKIGQS